MYSLGSRRKRMTFWSKLTFIFFLKTSISYEDRAAIAQSVKLRAVNPFPHLTILQQTTLNIFCQKIENLIEWITNEYKWKTLWQKEKWFLLSNFFFCHYVWPQFFQLYLFLPLSRCFILLVLSYPFNYGDFLCFDKIRSISRLLQYCRIRGKC